MIGVTLQAFEIVSKAALLMAVEELLGIIDAAERLQATNGVELKFAERPHQLPEALLKWYYPGRLAGQEFLYPQKAERGLIRDAKQDVMAAPLNSGAKLPTPGA